MITIIFGRAAQFFIALIMMRVATTLMAPEEMGRITLVFSTTAFFALFLINPVGMFINRRIHAWQERGRTGYYLTRYGIYLLVVGLIAAIILYFLYVLEVINFGMPMCWFISLVCGSLFFNTINQTAIPSLNLLGFSELFVLLTLLTGLASFILAVLMVQIIDVSARYWLLGILMGQLILGVIGAKVLFLKLNKSIDNLKIKIYQKHHLKMLFNFSWPVSLAAGLAWIQAQGYRYLMEDQLGLAELGLFTVGYGISAGVIAGFESVLTTYFQPRLYRDVSRGDVNMQAQAWNHYNMIITPSLILTAAFIVMLAPELTHLLLGVNFQSAVIYVSWGALSESARVLIGVYSLIAHVHMRTYWLIFPNLIGAILAIAMCVLLMPSLGAQGIGISLVVSGFVVVLIMHMLLVGKVGGRFPLRPIIYAGSAAVVLWGIAFGCKYFLKIPDWKGALSILFFSGIGYLGLQYLLLKPHFKEE